MATDIFSNPFTGTTQTWNAQGALITWAVADESAQDGLVSTLNADQNAVNAATGGSSPTKTFACLTQLALQYQRATNTQYPIGGNAPIRMFGAPTGTITLSSLLGPTTQLQEFLNAAGSACESVSMGIKPFASQSICQTAVKTKQPIIILHDCNLQVFNFQMQQQAQGLSLINVPLQLEFTRMTWHNS